MQIHQIKSTHKKKQKKRIGRGGKRGTYSGKGQKGQKSRAGAKLQPAIREFIKKYPKKRGYRFKGTQSKPAILNVGLLEKKFEKDSKINPELLLKMQLIRKIKKEVPPVKILGKGNLTKSLTIENCQVSKSAKEKIEKAGGRVKLKSQNSKLKTTT